MSSIEGFNCLPLLACNNAVIQTYQLYIVTVALCSSAPSPKPLKPCIEGFKRREGKHKRGVWGSRGHVDHVILHPHVIFEPAHVLLSYQGHGKGGWITGVTKIIRKFIAQMRQRQNLRKLTKFLFR